MSEEKNSKRIYGRDSLTTTQIEGSLKKSLTAAHIKTQVDQKTKVPAPPTAKPNSDSHSNGSNE